MVNMKEVNAKAQKMLDRFGITRIKAKDSIDSLTFEDRKLVEIVRCISDETEVCVFDETTTALSLEGRKILYELIHHLKDLSEFQRHLILMADIVVITVICLSNFPSHHHITNLFCCSVSIHFFSVQMSNNISVSKHRKIRALCHNFIHIM